ESIAMAEGVAGASSALLGIAGFLPLSERLQEVVGISPRAAADLIDIHRHLCERFYLPRLSPKWSLNRVRPLNHPALRLTSLADIVAGCAHDDGLLGRYLSLASSSKEWNAWLKKTTPPIGESRRQQIIVNAFAPFYGAYIDRTGSDDDRELVSELWDSLPGKIRDGVARAAKRQIVGAHRFPIRTALEEQGLHQIHRFGCRHLRCFECPIAALAARFER
ncbi:MAG: DUF2851 family protein, partial [Chloroflexota bacterium]